MKTLWLTYNRVSTIVDSLRAIQDQVSLISHLQCYRSAWQYASSFSTALSTTSTESHSVALHQALIPNWTSPAFSKFVDATRALVDELANITTTRDGKEEMSRCEEIFRQICWLEERFWPDVDGMGEDDDTAPSMNHATFNGPMNQNMSGASGSNSFSNMDVNGHGHLNPNGLPAQITNGQINGQINNNSMAAQISNGRQMHGQMDNNSMAAQITNGQINNQMNNNSMAAQMANGQMNGPMVNGAQMNGQSMNRPIVVPAQMSGQNMNGGENTPVSDGRNSFGLTNGNGLENMTQMTQSS